MPEGEVYQFQITENGVYRFDYKLLKKAGLAVDQLNPNQIHVYGQRGGALPQSNSAAAHQLTELAIHPVGLADSVFNQDDYLLVYAEGPDQTEYDLLNNFYAVDQNPYARENFLFVTVEDKPPNLVPKKPSLAFGWGAPIENYVGIYHYEENRTNIVHSGREWFGEAFEEENPTQTIPFSTGVIVSGLEAKLQTSLISISSRTSRYEVSLNQQSAGTLELGAAQQTLYGYRGRSATELHTIQLDHEGSNALSVQISSVTDGGAGYLDYVTLNVSQPLRYQGQLTHFRNPLMGTHSVSQFRVQQPTAEMLIWDVTDPLRVQQQQWNLVNAQARFQVFADTAREYVMFEPSAVIGRPTFTAQVNHHNILNAQPPELLIVTTEALQGQAKRLAQFRREHDGLVTQVILLTDIYRTFSAGRQDVTAIRNYIRHLYHQGDALRYVILFGDASYNYLNTEENTNVVPTYQSYESLHNVHSYASDDYFGFLEVQEGEWQESTHSVPHNLDVAIGRIPVNTSEEAAIVVDKLIHYASSPKTFGKWKQQLLFVADDGDENKHQSRSDFLASQTESQTMFHAERLFMDAYPQEEHSAPLVREKLDQQIEKGVFLVDFIGHGGETAWTDERILDLAMIDGWRNHDRLPIFLTATCEFGRYDDPRRQSGAERALLHPEGGAIAMLTTARPVFTGANFELSSAFYEVFTQHTGHEARMFPIRLGDIFRETKNRGVSGTSNRNFTLLGDPSMALAIPERTVTITSWQTSPAYGDTLRPLQHVTLQGEVQQNSGHDNQFNGIVYLDFFAQPEQQFTLGTEGTEVLAYIDQSARLFQGKATVKDGIFTATLRIPKNLSSEVGSGNIQLYAEDIQRQVDAMGHFGQFALGGEPVNAEGDVSPPQIQLFLNQVSYPTTTTVYNRPTLLVELADPSGINTLPGEYAIRLSIDGNESQEIQDWYETALDNFQAGSITFPLSYLPPGRHSLTLQASDTYLNSSQQTLEFTIVADSVFILESFSVYPNPTADEVSFNFSVSSESKPNRVEIHLFSPIGELIAKWQEGFDQPDQNLTIRCSLVTDIPATLMPGVYPFRFYLYDQQNQVVSRSGKLVFQ
ncbi:type IX secretion system sortase PorU [Tunicatimonas pelagia]|uniref:type IX secretion system sortase PorU n=1 Tax=Tunicatimonas pelagia TaxID=931531 RepID=UPI0026670192|nr:type IX secretion system sortase PorU [Tunicatimonas pelagia]WKN41339.1 type IX secretion system sortase PorU [Tunicatimonas pelagia]